jgi:hypothetical protein
MSSHADEIKRLKQERDVAQGCYEGQSDRCEDLQLALAKCTRERDALRRSFSQCHECHKELTLDERTICWQCEGAIKARMESNDRRWREERAKREEAERYAQYLEKALECEECNNSLLIPKDSPDTEYAGMPLPCFCGGCWGKEIEKRREAEAAQGAATEALRYYRDADYVHIPPGPSPLHDDRGQTAQIALANLTPAAARMVRIEKAAEQYEQSCEFRKHGLADCYGCGGLIVCKVVRGEGEKP